MGYQTILLLVGIIFAVSLNQAESIGIRRNAECTNLKASLDKQLAPWNGPKVRNATDSMKMDEPIVLWQGVLLIICFGAFASFIALIYWVIRLYVYEDTQLLDTFFDAGADVNAPLVATSIVTKYTWVSTFVVSSWAVTKWGIVGSFWYSAASVVPVFVFSMVAAELKIKSPGAKTYLQIIKARFGSATHAIFLTTSFLFHLFVCAIIMKGGLDMITYMVDGLSFEIASIIVGIVVVIYTLIGGLGGTFYVAYFSSAFTYVCILVMFIEVFYNLLGFDIGLPEDSENSEYGSMSASLIFQLADCATGTDASEVNVDDRFLTFFSKGSLLWAVIHTFASFAVVFVDNSTWQSAVAAKPQRSVYGFLTGGLCWFVIPWSFSVLIGSVFLALTIKSGVPIASEAEIERGLLPIIVLNQILSPAGEFVFFMLVVVALCTSAASEVLSASAVITYDIYQTYVSPIPPVTFSPAEEMSLKMQVALRLEEHRVYDRRCATIKYAFVVAVGVILIPIALVINVIPIDMAWLLQFTGIFFGSAVCPIAFGVSWYRITSWGMMSGSIGGFIAGVASWLIYASTLNDKGLADFRENTGDVYAMIVGNSVSFGVGLILCIIVSLSGSCCNDDLIEAEEWHKTRSLDNPVCSWIDSYMEDMKDEEIKELAPSISTIRKTYRGAEICGYFVGILLAVGILLIWPAFMLLTYLWEQHVWNSWWLVCFIWLCIAAAYCIFLPLMLEVYNICSQREYNRTIKRRHKKEKDYEYYAQVDENSVISGSVGKRSQYIDATATEMTSVTINPAS